MSPRPITRHGTPYSYKRGCHCWACTRANAEQARAEYARRKTRLAADPSLRPHGQVNTYRNWGCRCGQCVTAWSVRGA